MQYKISKNFIEIIGKDDFKADQILDCGQIFSYKKADNGWIVLSKDKKAQIKETAEGYIIITESVKYFENFFDLKTDYCAIKHNLSKFDLLKQPILFGSGIRILKQDLFETLISFIVSANNNIKRIKIILTKLRESLGENKGDWFAFPTRDQLMSVDQTFFQNIGAGYRAKYLYQVVRQIDENSLLQWNVLSTAELRKRLISLSGVGPKVADCVLLFGYGRKDVFPVDTWIHQMYNKFYEPLENREKIRNNLTSEFGDLSGYAQQYLFFFMRDVAP